MPIDRNNRVFDFDGNIVVMQFEKSIICLCAISLIIKYGDYLRIVTSIQLK